MDYLRFMILTLLIVGGSLQSVEESAEKNEHETQDPVEEKTEKTPPYIAHLELGEIEGKKETSRNGKPFYSFLGVPYAEPPIEELRFKDPVALNHFGRFVDGQNYPPPCSQIDIWSFVRNGSVIYRGKEDCLYLNIYTPEFDEDLSDFPVMVFFPGVVYASSDASDFEPYDLMNEDVVLVVLQYRLGVLGFLSTEDTAISGNFGLKDQTLALRWVNKYIHHFGGNNLRVTLFGHGAGSSSVHFQMLTHHTIGLFQKVILQSGNSLCPWAVGGVHKEAAYYIGQQFNCTADINSGDQNLDATELLPQNERMAECLRKVDAEDLTVLLAKFYAWGILPTIFGPYADGTYLPDTPEFLLKESRHKKTDMIVGTVKDEGSFLVHSLFASEANRMSLKFDFPNMGPISMEFTTDDVAAVNMSIKAFDFYAGGLKIDESDANNITKLYGDRHQVLCTDQVASMHYTNGNKLKKTLYMYEFQHRGSRSFGDFFDLMIGREWVSHGDDLLYLFPLKSRGKQERTNEDLAMSDLMTKMWVNFAATGNPTPNDDLGFEWSPYTSEDPSRLIVTTEPYMTMDDRKKMRDFWTSLPTKQNLYFYPEKFEEIIKQMRELKEKASTDNGSFANSTLTQEETEETTSDSYESEPPDEPKQKIEL